MTGHDVLDRVRTSERGGDRLAMLGADVLRA